MGKRILFGSIAAAILLLFLFFGTAGVIVLVYIVGLIAMFEFNNALRKGGFSSSGFAGILTIALMIPAYFWLGMMGIMLLIAGCMYLNFIYYILMQQVNMKMIFSMIQFVYPGMLFAFFPPLLLTDRIMGMPYLILLITCCFGADTFAYFTGMLLGKHKLCPAISPKKTIEGAVGGFLGSIAVSALMFYLLPIIYKVEIQFSLAITVGIVIGIFAQFGDLTASLIKRICNIKDFGNLIPGHGGILDRLDSILFCLPIVYAVILFFHM